MSEEESNIELKNMPIDCEEYLTEGKYFYHEPYMTPNNYDLYFDYASIPSNIPIEKSYDLRKRLQKLMPLTKIIHINMDSDTIEHDNNIHVSTSMKINYKDTTGEQNIKEVKII